jgi:hypothetical protein
MIYGTACLQGGTPLFSLSLGGKGAAVAVPAAAIAVVAVVAVVMVVMLRT